MSSRGIMVAAVAIAILQGTSWNAVYKVMVAVVCCAELMFTGTRSGIYPTSIVEFTKPWQVWHQYPHGVTLGF